MRERGIQVLIGILLVAAFVGFAACVAVHACTFFGIHSQQLSPVTGWLFASLFVIWPSVVIFAKKNEKKGLDLVQIAPKWMTAITVSILVYGLCVFLFVCGLRGGAPDVLNGRKALVSYGKVVTYLTDQQYETELVRGIRNDSAGIMVFYSFAFLIVYATLKAKATKSFNEDDYSRRD